MNNKDPMLRVLYILLVPIVLLIIVLNSGLLQRAVPAVTLHGRSYTVVRYNFYYFENYNAFLEENEFALDELGYDPNTADSSQYTADGITWKEFFQRQAEESMAETAYYFDLAAEAGYVFSEEELLPVEERLAEHAALQVASNISAKNYYTAYYGSGMTEEIYTAELTRMVKAEAYRAYLVRAAAPSRAEIDAYITANAIPDYRTADLRVITLEALPDRETGEVGQTQQDALAQKMDRLVARYEAGESFQELQAAFSTRALGDRQGYLLNATRLDLPQVVSDGLLFPEGGITVFVGGFLTAEDGATAYFILLDGFREDGPTREATLALGEEAMLARAEAEIAENYVVTRQRFGMLLATA